MFTTLIVQPLFNLLVLIYALLPGHNFGVAIILFAILARVLMWPLVRKQLYNAKAMRELQPELKRIKQETKGDRQKESQMVMELYKEKEINPFSTIGLLIIQIPILLALYSGLRRVIDDPNSLITFSYSFVHNLPWMKELAADITKFDATLFGIVDLTKPALGKSGGIYWPAMILVIASAVSQYFQSKQLMPNDKDGRNLRTLLKQASDGKSADQSEINAAVGRSTRYFIPIMIFLFTVNLASALSLYWLTTGIVALIQQARVLKQDETELEKIADKSVKTKDVSKIAEAEIVAKPKTTKKQSKKKSSAKNNKRRKR